MRSAPWDNNGLLVSHAAWDVGAVHGVHAVYCVSKLGTAWSSAALRPRGVISQVIGSELLAIANVVVGGL
jgi:hypothetical protein